MSLTDHAQLRANLAAIQAKICSLESQLVLLHSEERTALASLDIIVYPILTLPTEMTIEIFQHYAGYPLILASVCTQWRDIALSCPRLWPVMRDLENPPVVADLLRSRLLRVGNLPFRIDTLLSATDEILSILASYFPQLLNLELSVLSQTGQPASLAIRPLASNKAIS